MKFLNKLRKKTFRVHRLQIPSRTWQINSDKERSFSEICFDFKNQQLIVDFREAFNHFLVIKFDKLIKMDLDKEKFAINLELSSCEPYYTENKFMVIDNIKGSTAKYQEIKSDEGFQFKSEFHGKSDFNDLRSSKILNVKIEEEELNKAMMMFKKA